MAVELQRPCYGTRTVERETAGDGKEEEERREMKEKVKSSN